MKKPAILLTLLLFCIFSFAQFTISGKVIDAEVSLPFHPEFDKIALSIIKDSPAWTPATAHNRKVKAYRRQPITFAQPE